MPTTSESPLFTIQYTVVHRFIHNFVQQYEKHFYTLSLTRTSIISDSQHFQLEKLIDVSYKPFTNGEGFLYLHTDEGVFTYVVSSDPSQFIAGCHALISNS